MKTKKTLLICLLLFGYSYLSVSQNLMDILESEQQDTSGYTSPAFKMTRITIGHSTEVRSKGVLEVFVTNRLWNLPKSKTEKSIAIKLNSRIALEYGLLDNLTFGIGGSTFDGLFDGHLKYKLLTQKKGKRKMPFNVTLFQNTSYNSNSIPNQSEYGNSNKLSFTSQVLISSKVSSNFSLQVSPSYVHRTYRLSQEDPRDFFVLGLGARYKIGNHLSVVSEYYKSFNTIESFETHSPFAFGVNWEIGDVLLQFMLTNAVSAVEDSFITQTRNKFNFENPNLNFGFNATYVIHFKNRLKKK